MKRQILHPVGQRIVVWTLFGSVLSCSLGRTNGADQNDPDIPKTQQQDKHRDRDSPQTKFSEAQLALVNQVFASRLLEVASEYKQFTRVDQKMRWSPTRCSFPTAPTKYRGAISASESDETHGKKLYYLYAKKPQQYGANVLGVSADARPVRAPLGQVLVKEAWEPVQGKESKGKRPQQSKPLDQSTEALPKGNKRPYAVVGKREYHAGEKKGLYVMFKTLENTPGTDRGWVYGTVSPDGKQVTSVGRVENCMQCHRDAPHDRQIGYPRVAAAGGLTP